MLRVLWSPCMPAPNVPGVYEYVTRVCVQLARPPSRHTGSDLKEADIWGAVDRAIELAKERDYTPNAWASPPLIDPTTVTNVDEFFELAVWFAQEASKHDGIVPAHRKFAQCWLAAMTLFAQQRGVSR